MNEFEKSNWNNPEYSQKYLDEADIYIPKRNDLLKILCSFYHKFIYSDKKRRILDLGCGNGILSKMLYNQNGNIEIVVTDGSKDMLIEAKKELEGLPVLDFCQISFEEIIQGKFNSGFFDFIVSSFAIHHLPFSQKKKVPWLIFFCITLHCIVLLIFRISIFKYQRCH